MKDSEKHNASKTRRKGYIEWVNKNSKILIIILACSVIALPVLSVVGKVFYITAKDRVLRALGIPQYIIGNMNGVELTVPKEYQEFSPQYSGEDRWKPLKNPPKRTYKSGIDSLELVVKWPSMEHQYQGNNADSFRTRGDVDGSKDWMSLTVESDFENLSKSQILERIEYMRSHARSGITGLLHGYIEGKFLHMPIDNHFNLNGIDQKTGLNWANVIGPDAGKPKLGNVVVYWDGDISKKISTLIVCTGPLVARLEPTKSCKQYYEMPELHASIAVYYYLPHLSEWKEIQYKTRAFVLSFKNKPISQ